MKILFAFNLYYYQSTQLNSSYYFFVDTLKHMGHEVIIIDFGTLNRIGGNTVVSKTILSTIATYRPDLFFVVPSRNEIPMYILNYITKCTKTTTIAWNSDDDRRWDDYSSKFAFAYDYMLTTYESAAQSAQKKGLTNILLTQWAANPRFNRPLNLPKKYDASFIGMAYDDRPEYIKALIEAGFNIKFGGMNWNKYFENAQTEFSQEEISIITNQSKISLVFSKGCGSENKQIKGRVFESPAYQVCTFIEETPGLDIYFVPGKEVVVFQNKEDLVEKMKYYLTHDDHRDTIARNGYVRVKNEHTYEKRLKAAFEQINFEKKSDPVLNAVASSIVWALLGTQDIFKRMKTSSLLCVLMKKSIRKRLLK